MKLLKSVREKKESVKELSVFIRLNAREYERVKLMANRYAAKNVSAWVREAATKYEPMAKDLT